MLNITDVFSIDRRLWFISLFFPQIFFSYYFILLFFSFWNVLHYHSKIDLRNLYDSTSDLTVETLKINRITLFNELSEKYSSDWSAVYTGWSLVLINVTTELKHLAGILNINSFPTHYSKVIVIVKGRHLNQKYRNGQPAFLKNDSV